MGRKFYFYLIALLSGCLLFACSIKNAYNEKTRKKIVLKQDATYEQYSTTYVLLLAEIDTFKDSITVNLKAAESSLDRICEYLDYMASQIADDKQSSELIGIKVELSKIFSNIKEGRSNQWLLRQIDFLKEKVKKEFKLE